MCRTPLCHRASLLVLVVGCLLECIVLVRLAESAASTAPIVLKGGDDGESGLGLPRRRLLPASKCLALVRNRTYAYRQWDNHCRSVIGKGFQCFDINSIIDGVDNSDGDPDNGSTIGNASNWTGRLEEGKLGVGGLKVPLFIKLHKVGGTTLGDVLHLSLIHI